MTKEDFDKVVTTLRDKYFHEDRPDGSMVFNTHEHRVWFNGCYYKDPVWSGYLHVLPEENIILFSFNKELTNKPKESNIGDIVSCLFHGKEDDRWLSHDDSKWEDYLRIDREVTGCWHESYGRKTYTLINKESNTDGYTTIRNYCNSHRNHTNLSVIIEEGDNISHINASVNGRYMMDSNGETILDLLEHTYTAKETGNVIVLMKNNKRYIIHV